MAPRALRPAALLRPPAAAAVLAAAAAAGDCTLALHPGLRVDGNDIRGVNASSAGDCCQQCGAEAACGFFVFVAPKSLCWLKTSGDGASRPDASCTAGGTVPAPAQPTPAPPPGACATDADCHMAGTCAGGKCACDHGWTGADCARINFGDAYPCGSGGLCMHGEFHNKATWGGEAVPGDDGKWHMYAAMFPNKSLSAWLTDSQVVHAVADEAHGPYNATDVALGPRGGTTDAMWDSVTAHNPAVQRAPDGTYLLYYMGSSVHPGADAGDVGLDCSSHPEQQSVCMQRVGLATSASPAGPWTRRDAPILPPGPDGSWDDLFTTNPTPHVFANGSVLLVYKARSKENPNSMSTGVARAEHWAGPYVRSAGRITDLPGNCEDAGIYRSPSGVFRMILHCGCSYRYVWSLDGTSRHGTAPPVPWCNVNYSDGTTGVLGRRERPKWVIGADGQPSALFTGVEPKTATDPVHGTDTFTLAVSILP